MADPPTGMHLGTFYGFALYVEGQTAFAVDLVSGRVDDPETRTLQSTAVPL